MAKMAKFARLSRPPRARPLAPGLMALAAIVVAAVLLTVGQVHLQSQMVQAQTVQAQMEQERIQARIRAQNVAADRAALVALYDATGGDSWTNNTGWKSNDSLGDWHGVNTLNGRVTALSLNNNSLTGSLPTELGNLGRLTSLGLYDNNLTGSIPAELGNLSNLTGLSLYNNQLSGSIPADLGQLGSLRSLALSNNQLSGIIPTELGQLGSLTTLSLDRNTLTGTIPAELGQLSRLTTLSLHTNSLTGRIPPELGQLSKLTALSLHTNSLTGTVPTELGQLSALTSLRLQSNQLTGELPATLTGISTLTTLLFQSNAGLCASLDSSFQTWLDGISTLDGEDCPLTRIRTGAVAPVVGEPVTARLTSQDARLARISATQQEYDSDPCIGYDTSGSRAGVTVPLWTWERADADSNDPNSPDDSTWAEVTAGRHPNATFVYLPQSGDEGKFLRASLTHDTPPTTDTTEAIGPIVADHGVTGGDIVAVAAPTGTLAVGNDLSVSLPAAAAAERQDRAINPRPESWQWERSDDGSTDWTNVTPYHRHCEQSDTAYSLTSDDAGKHLNTYVYYNDDSSSSVVLKRGELSSGVGPVTQ